MYNNLNFKVSNGAMRMTTDREVLHRFLIDVFHEILRVEERSIHKNGCRDLSIREMHVLEAVSVLGRSGQNSAAQIAEFLGIVPGTLTAAATVLERKGYLVRERDATDRRVVRLAVTAKGERANAGHEAFHRELIDDILNTLTEAEADVFVRALQKTGDFFRHKQQEGTKTT